MNKTKPFSISKQSVMSAWRKVKANKGTYGVDQKSLMDFESRLEDNLYKIWNRLSSGTYFPPPVRAVEIPKGDGGQRILGIPTVSDRVAQTVVKGYLEPLVEPKFHKDSYGYRPGKSALEAVGVTRKRCWESDWCIDLDIKGFFDNLDHDLCMKAVRYHTEEKWIALYVERWLKAPLEQADGSQIERAQGTPQGGVISPLLANLFMHHAFDAWMERHNPSVKFERYADDVVLHCSTLQEAEEVLEAIKRRLKVCNLELHPEKTKIVYCKDDDRKGSHEHESLNFLGYTFRPRLAKSRYGNYFVGFTPAISQVSSKRVGRAIRRWRLHLRSEKAITDLARMINAQVQGWVNYYGGYCKSALYPTLRKIEQALMRWVMRKYKRYRAHKQRAKEWLGRVRKREPGMFVHWKLGIGSPVG